MEGPWAGACPRDAARATGASQAGRQGGRGGGRGVVRAVVRVPASASSGTPTSGGPRGKGPPCARAVASPSSQCGVIRPSPAPRRRAPLA